MRRAIASVIRSYCLSQGHADILDFSVTIPDPRFGDYSTNAAMIAAKTWHRDLPIVAQEMSRALSESFGMSTVEIAGPGFINIRLPARSLYEQLRLNNFTVSKKGVEPASKGTLVIDCPSVNAAKGLPVRYLRSGIIGDSLKQLFTLDGWHVITSNYVDFYEDEVNEPSASDSAAARNRYLNQTAYVLDVLKRYQMVPDENLFKPEVIERASRLVEQCLENGIATVSTTGAAIAKLDDYGLRTPAILANSKGSPLYAACDLALLQLRIEKHHPNKVFYVVGSDQEYYFEQLCALTHKLQINTDLEHISFGPLLCQNSEAPELQESHGAEFLCDLLSEQARQTRISPCSSNSYSRKIALGTIKYGILSRRRISPCSSEQFTQLEHEGSFFRHVIDTMESVASILPPETARFPIAAHSETLSTGDFEQEKPLLSKLLEYRSTLRRAIEERDPFPLARYIHECAQCLRTYQQKCLSQNKEAPLRAEQIEILLQTLDTLSSSMQVLGIEAPPTHNVERNRPEPIVSK